MKAALFTAGQPRFTESFVKIQDQLVGLDEIDLYFSFWSGSVPENIYEKIESLIHNSIFKIKNINLINQPIFNEQLYTNLHENTKFPNVLLMWYGLKQVFESLPDDYDFYIRYRLDARLNKPINFKNFDPSLKKIFLPGGPRYGIGDVKINDQFAIGNYNQMKYYCDLYDLHKEYYNNGLILHPETHLSHHLSMTDSIELKKFRSVLRQDSVVEIYD
jgi:hypothetical protein